MMSLLARSWRGQVSLAKTFWLGWAIPVIGGNLIISYASWRIISNLGLIGYYILVALVVCYGIAAAIPVWRSATTYSGSGVLKYGAQAIAVLASTFQIFAAGVTIFALVSINLGIDPTHDPDRVAEKTAIPSASHPLAGFWKSSPTDDFGLAIAPAKGKLYSVSFCGPGGCFKPGTYRPNTSLVGDKNYQVISVDELRVRGQDGWSTYRRAASRGKDDCPPK